MDRPILDPKFNDSSEMIDFKELEIENRNPISSLIPKLDVEGSNPFSRSNKINHPRNLANRRVGRVAR